MRTAYFFGFLAGFALVAGCATPDEEGVTSASALAERVTAAELETTAVTHYDWVEAQKPNTPDATSTVLFAVDDEAPVQVEGSDELDDIVSSTIFDHSLEVTTKTSPLFYFRSRGAFEPGTHDCKDVEGGAALRVGSNDLYRSPGQPCSITITKTYRETLSPAAIVVGAHPRLIVIGHLSATLKNEAGATKDVRAGFVLAGAMSN